jgi:imidazolonepropionase-like amidohydrolase
MRQIPSLNRLFVRILALTVALVPWSAWSQTTTRLDGGRDAQPTKATLAIVGGTLIDGHEGTPVHHAVVLVDGNKIAAVGTRDALKVPAGAKVIDARGMTILPGLIDVHVHLDMLGHTSYPRWHQLYSARYPEIMEVAARQLIFQGVTTAADLWGDPESLKATRQKIDRGQIPGPRMKMSMGLLANWGPQGAGASTAGRVDVAMTTQVKTLDATREGTLTAIRHGADFIKVHNGLSGEQVAVVAEEARRRGMWITGHVDDRANLLARIRNGQDAIEHLGLASGNSPTIHPEVVQALLDQRTFIVPTLIQSKIQTTTVEWPDWIDNPRARLTTPAEFWREIRESLEHPERLTYFGRAARVRSMDEQGAKFRQLYQAGVRLLAGTDSGTPLNFQTDALVRELDLMVQYGMPPMEVLATATRRNAEYLKMADQVGTVTAGMLADIVVVDGNPLLSMRDLRNVVVVVKDGKILKGAAADALHTSQ